MSEQKEKKTFGEIFLGNGIISNPVLIQCVGLCSVVAASTTVKNAFFLSVALIADLIVTTFIASAILKKVPRFIRVAIYLVVGIIILYPALWFIENVSLINMSMGMKVYLPLVAVNSLTAIQCETFSVKNKIRDSFFNALAVGLGASLVTLICGALREVIGSGTFAGHSFDFPFTLSGMAMPFGCLIILGFLAALLNAGMIRRINLNRRKPEEAQPEEVHLGIDDISVSEVLSLDLQEEDDEYAYLLASVNELIDSFSTDEGGDGK